MVDRRAAVAMQQPSTQADAADGRAEGLRWYWVASKFAGGQINHRGESTVAI